MTIATNQALSRRTGFALPAVLAVIGVVTLIFLVAMTALSSLTSEAMSARARIRFLTRAMSAEALIVYISATEPVVPAGLNIGGPRLFDDSMSAAEAAAGSVLKLDGRGYRLDIDGPLLVNPQDQAGLINVPYLTEAAHTRLGEFLGLPVPDARRLAALYRDYVDVDDLESTGGAEASEYAPGAIPNRAMRRPEELLALAGLRQQVSQKAWQAARANLAMDATSPNENVNTATSLALQILYGASPRQAETAIAAREQQPFTSFADFAAIAGVPDFSGDRGYTFPSGRTQLKISDGRSAWTYRARLTLTPFGLERPVWIDQTELKEAPGRAVADFSDAIQLPYTPR